MNIFSWGTSFIPLKTGKSQPENLIKTQYSFCSDTSAPTSTERKWSASTCGHITMKKLLQPAHSDSFVPTYHHEKVASVINLTARIVIHFLPVNEINTVTNISYWTDFNTLSTMITGWHDGECNKDKPSHTYLLLMLSFTFISLYTVCACVHACVCVRTCMRVCMCAHVHVRVYTHVHVCMWACICVHCIYSHSCFYNILQLCQCTHYLLSFRLITIFISMYMHNYLYSSMLWLWNTG